MDGRQNSWELPIPRRQTDCIRSPEDDGAGAGAGSGDGSGEGTMVAGAGASPAGRVGWVTGDRPAEGGKPAQRWIS